ncbi:MAG: FMN-binding protein [Gemmatimonadota bacterium]|nr:MAG: FMN-binding protein [Gemmatimonadota bacterium]
MPRNSIRIAVAATLVLATALLAPPASAEVYHSRESALRLAFPGADEIVPHDLTLTALEADEVASRAGARLASRLVTVYEGRAQGSTLGWAFLDTHPVRSLPETLLLVVTPQGRVAATHLLAFHEPEEYKASPRWFAQFSGHGLDPDLALGKGVSGIAGSTLTARAVTASVRRMLAVWQVKLSGAAPPDTAS